MELERVELSSLVPKSKEAQTETFQPQSLGLLLHTSQKLMQGV